jgi:hypothetical protein
MENIEENKELKMAKPHCFFGVHRYQIIDTKEMNNNRNDIIGRIYVQQCSHCGKIHSTSVKFYDF